MSLDERLVVVRERIAAAGGDPDSVRIVAVTKGQGIEAVNAARRAGLQDVGENYAQELIQKHDQLTSQEDLRWHFLGRIQTNKVSALAQRVNVWQSVDRAEVAEKIARSSPGAKVFVQVNLAGDPNRPGCSFDAAASLVRSAGDLGLDVRGLMGVGPLGEDADPAFGRLADLRTDLELPELSIGMSGDLEAAIRAGTTMLRLGTVLFGPRPERAILRR